MRLDYTVNVELKNLPVIHKINGRFFEQDSEGNRIKIVVVNDGVPAELEGAVIASIIRADGETITAYGALEGCAAHVDLPSTAYAVTGRLQVFVKLKKDEDVVTLAAVEGKVYPSVTSEVITNGNV